MDAFYERLAVRAATIDELLSDDFEGLPGQKLDADVSAQRLAAWCRSCASGDWSLFGRRLERDGLTFGEVLSKFATVRRRASSASPRWIDDATWIEAALQSQPGQKTPVSETGQAEPFAFEDLFAPLIEQADARVWSDMDSRETANVAPSARASLRLALLEELSELCAPALFDFFIKGSDAQKPLAAAEPQRDGSTSRYDQFVFKMKAGGFRSLFEDKPVLLRLIALIARQWIDTSSELVRRLDADLPGIRRDILQSDAVHRVATIESELSDRHNGGRAVKILAFDNGARIVYKPKDLRLDVQWHALVEGLNRATPPIELKAVRAIACDGYGWTEFIDHAGCDSQEDCNRFFRRAGAWLALFHCFSATDMHQENMIAAGDHPVPIDVEMVLQPSLEENNARFPEEEAFKAASETLANSVMMVGLLPAYRRTHDNNIYSTGGLTSNWNPQAKLKWKNVNTDTMRLVRVTEAAQTNPNTPHIAGRYVKFGDYLDEFIAGFEEYSDFLRRETRGDALERLFDGFAGLPVRKVVHYTRFYHMLMHRLKDHRTMNDGVMWSAQADFIARLADWDNDSDPYWPLQAAERRALTSLDVPHFTLPSDRGDVAVASRHPTHSHAISGLDRARSRVRGFDREEIEWQVRIIRENMSSIARATPPPALREISDAEVESPSTAAPTPDVLVARADGIARELSLQAIRRGPGAAWIGLDWLGDSDYFQLACLGPDLYNGVSGIGVFLAAHAAVTGSEASHELALAAVSRLRKNLNGQNAARIARSMGIGGATGLGSVVYALAAMAKILDDKALTADARVAADLIADDLIAADKQLDVTGGSAGAILGLLRLHRDTRAGEVLSRAVKCGDHLMGQPRTGETGRRSWVARGFGPQGLNGISHGAAGFAYALAALGAASGREEFTAAAAECIAFEDTTYNAERHNWPDLRRPGEPVWSCQWCHGAPGIGLARLATAKFGGMNGGAVTQDIRNAVEGAELNRPRPVDTLCCGTLGRVEFFCEAGDALGRGDLLALATRQLAPILDRIAPIGEERGGMDKKRFNLGLFRGLAGAGYTVLRRLDAGLPNVLIWE